MKLGPAEVLFKTAKETVVIREVLRPKLREAGTLGGVVDGLLNKNSELESKTAPQTLKEIDFTINIYCAGRPLKKCRKDSYVAFWLSIRREFLKTLKTPRKIQYQGE